MFVAFAQIHLIKAQAGVSSKARGLNFARALIDIHTSCMRTAKALASLRICEDSPAHSLLADAIITELSCNYPIMIYCEFRNFRQDFIFAYKVKRHTCHAKKSQLGHDLHTSVNDRVISPFREGFILPKLRTGEISRR